MNRQWFIKHQHSILFALLLIVLFFFFGFHKIMFREPSGSHTWRQTDCTSLALKFAQNGLNPFKPQVHNFLGDNGYGISEFPIIYYSVAVLYKIFGHHIFLFRLVNMIILFAGMFAAFRLAWLFMKDPFWGYMIALLVFSSPVLLFHGSGFLSDAPAFCITLIGLWQFFRFYETGKPSAFYLSIAFLLLASLLKVTAGMSLICVGAMYAIELFSWYEFKNGKPLFGPIKWKAFGTLAAAVGVVTIWYLLAKSYNAAHDTTYFSTRTWPMWDMDANHVLYVLHRFLFEWSVYFYNPITYALLFLLTAFILLLRKDLHPLLSVFYYLLLIGVLTYGMLWFYAFQDHDYYWINTTTLVLFLILNCAWVAKRYYPRVFHSWAFRVLVLGFVIFNVTYAKRGLKAKYYNFAHEDAHPALYKNEFQDYLRTVGINKTDLVVSLPDRTPNMSLYLMDQPGFTTLNCEPMGADCMDEFVSKGARYLIITDPGVLENQEITKYSTNKIGDYEGINIYRL